MEKFIERNAGYGFTLKSFTTQKEPGKIKYVLEAGFKNEAGQWKPDWHYKTQWDKGQGKYVPADKPNTMQIYLGDRFIACKILKEALAELDKTSDPAMPSEEEIPF